MAYAPRPGLGIAPVIIAAAIPEVEKLFSSIFGGNSQALEAGVATEVQNDTTTITNALADIATPGTTAYNTFVKLRCLAGDASMNVIGQSILTPFPVPPGCGYAHQDSRNYAASAVLSIAYMAIQQGLNVPAAYTFQNDSPAGTATTRSVTGAMSTTQAPTPSTSTVYTSLPGGISVGLPVPTSTLLTATIGGLPLVAWLGVGVAR